MCKEGGSTDNNIRDKIPGKIYFFCEVLLWAIFGISTNDNKRTTLRIQKPKIRDKKILWKSFQHEFILAHQQYIYNTTMYTSSRKNTTNTSTYINLLLLFLSNQESFWGNPLWSVQVVRHQLLVGLQDETYR